CQKLLHLLRPDLLLQNDFAGAEVAGFARADRFFANIIHSMVEDIRAALGTFAQRFLAGEINRRCSLAVLAFFLLAKVEFDLELGAQVPPPPRMEIPACCKPPAAARSVCRESAFRSLQFQTSGHQAFCGSRNRTWRIETLCISREFPRRISGREF